MFTWNQVGTLGSVSADAAPLTVVRVWPVVVDADSSCGSPALTDHRSEGGSTELANRLTGWLQIVTNRCYDKTVTKGTKEWECFGQTAKAVGKETVCCPWRIRARCGRRSVSGEVGGRGSRAGPWKPWWSLGIRFQMLKESTIFFWFAIRNTHFSDCKWIMDWIEQDWKQECWSGRWASPRGREPEPCQRLWRWRNRHDQGPYVCSRISENTSISAVGFWENKKHYLQVSGLSSCIIMQFIGMVKNGKKHLGFILFILSISEQVGEVGI